MTYDFAMDKKTVISVLAGWAVMAVLLFAAGWIVGMNWTTGAAASTATGTTANASQQAALPKEPVLRSDADQSDVDATGKTTGTAPPEAAAPGGVTGVSRPPLPGPDDAAGNKATVPPVDDQEKLVQAADPQLPASASDQSDGADAKSVAFTVQVGVFLDPKEASRFLSTMERSGYSPSFFADRDAENRQWYAIRIGAYTDKNQAAQAAANFTKQESIKAVVRPLGSL